MLKQETKPLRIPDHLFEVGLWPPGRFCQIRVLGHDFHGSGSPRVALTYTPTAFSAAIIVLDKEKAVVVHPKRELDRKNIQFHLSISEEHNLASAVTIALAACRTWLNDINQNMTGFPGLVFKPAEREFLSSVSPEIEHLSPPAFSEGSTERISEFIEFQGLSIGTYTLLEMKREIERASWRASKAAKRNPSGSHRAR